MAPSWEVRSQNLCFFLGGGAKKKQPWNPFKTPNEGKQLVHRMCTLPSLCQGPLWCP